MSDLNKFGLYRKIVTRMSPRCPNPACRHPIDCGEVVAELFERIAEALAAGEEVRIQGFGSFTVRFNGGRPITSVVTGTTVMTRNLRRVIFKTYRPLRDRLNPSKDPVKGDKDE